MLPFALTPYSRILAGTSRELFGENNQKSRIIGDFPLKKTYKIIHNSSYVTREAEFVIGGEEFLPSRTPTQTEIVA